MIKQIHCLPGENGDSTWLARLNTFELQATLRQVAFKRQHWPGLADGVWSKRPSESYPHILPEGHLKDAFFPDIADAVLDYCSRNMVAIHSEALNLRSSQVACFNVMFPLKQDLALAHRALAPLLPGVQQVTCIEFEYTGNAGATLWLGEPPGGMRGQNRSSIDVAVWWTNGMHHILTLVEWKYTERSYGTCGGATSEHNDDKAACKELKAAADGRQKRCYLTQGKQHRRYWEHMEEAGIDLAALRRVAGCPFRGAFYQMMRQYQLAAYLRRPEAQANADKVEVASVAFRGNTSLSDAGPYGCLGSSITEAWNASLRGVPALRHVEVESVAAAIRAEASTSAAQLVGYLSERYGL